jgi:integron integrase
MRHNILPEFENFLISRQLVPEKNVPLYAIWVGKFLSFLDLNRNINEKSTLLIFIEQLKNQGNVKDWQLKQAEAAVKLYKEHFLGDAVPGGKHEVDIRTIHLPNRDQALDKMRQLLRLKHYSYRTERSYLDWVKRFFDYLQHLKGDTISTLNYQTSDVRDFLSHLAIKQKVAASTQNQAFNALLFLFRDVLNIDPGDLSKTVRARRGKRLPVVLTGEEVQKLLAQLSGKDLLMAHLLYGSGLRLMEMIRLRVQCIDFGTSTIIVRNGKGDKDRTTILPELIKEPLQQHLEEVKKLHEEDLIAGYGEVFLPDALARKYPSAAKEWRWQYIFPSSRLSVDPRSGKVRRHHVSERTPQVAVSRAVKKAGITKHATLHTLRHSFATHLLMNGINIREIQDLLGHKSVETTMIYTHVLRNLANSPQSPLDSLYSPKTQ